MADEKNRPPACTFCKNGRKQPSGQTCEVCKGTGQMPIYVTENAVTVSVADCQFHSRSPKPLNERL